MEKTDKNKQKGWFEEYIKDNKLIFGLFLLFIIINTYIFNISLVSGHSMDSTLEDGQFIGVNVISYKEIPGIKKAKTYKRGDIITFDSKIKKPENRLSIRDKILGESNYYVKRIIGIENDIVKIYKGKVFLKKKGDKDFQELKEDYLNQENRGQTYIFNTNKDKEFIFTVPKNSVFVMGDNRNHSTDSRTCFSYGCNISNKHSPYVNIEDIIGKVIYK